MILSDLTDEVVTMALAAYRVELLKTKDGCVSERDRAFVWDLINRLDAATKVLESLKPSKDGTRNWRGENG